MTAPRFEATRAFAASLGADDFVAAMETINVWRAAESWLSVSRTRHWHEGGEEERRIRAGCALDWWRSTRQTEYVVGLIEGILNRTRSAIAVGLRDGQRKVRAPEWLTPRGDRFLYCVDVGIIPLLRAVWDCGIFTEWSCQGHRGGSPWITFGSPAEARAFCWAMTRDEPAAWPLNQEGREIHFPPELLETGPGRLRSARRDLERLGFSVRAAAEASARARADVETMRLQELASPPVLEHLVPHPWDDWARRAIES